MIDYFLVPQGVRISISLLAATTVLTQLLYVGFNYYKAEEKLISRAKQLYELFLLFYLILLAAAPGSISFIIREGFVVKSLFGNLRFAIFICIIICLSLDILENNRDGVLPTIITSLTLPITEGHKLYLHLFLTSIVLLYHLYRSLKGFIEAKNQLESSVSNTSIKEAIDSLPSGLLFHQADGSVLLINLKMQELMTKLTSKIWVDGYKFQEFIWEKCDFISKSNDKIFVKISEEVWKFSRSEVLTKKKKYIQLTATDVSKQWILIKTLEAENEKLEEKSRHLLYLIDNLFKIRYYQETLRMRSQLHDVLGQHISLFGHWLRKGETFEHSKMTTWIKELKTELYRKKNYDPNSMLKEIIDVSKLINVNVYVEGNLPDEVEVSQVFVSTIREAITNGARHGFATEAYVNIGEDDNKYFLKIEDNGASALDEPESGGGISGMRRKAESLGGKLVVKTQPKFSISVEIPKIKIFKKGE